MSSTSTEILRPTVDQDRAQRFAESLVNTINQGALSLMLSLGHRSGLFDTMAGMAPTSSAGIAAEAGLDERYVREWLGAMVTGGIVDYDETAGTYCLPAEHAMSLTRGSASGNIAVVAQFIPVLAGVEDRILGCFENGGGLPYEAFPRFHEVMAEESAQTVVAVLESDILPLVPGLEAKLEAGIDVLDVGCGSGRALVALATSFPQSRFTGYDLCDETVEAARAAAAARGLSNVRFEKRDVSDLSGAGAFDLVTAFDAIHDQADPASVLAGIKAALRPGGVFLMQDIHASSHVHENCEHPIGPLLYTISCLHCMTVSLSQGGAGLGTCWGEQLALGMLADAGFANVEVQQLPHDIMNSFYVARPE